MGRFEKQASCSRLGEKAPKANLVEVGRQPQVLNPS